MEALEKVAAGLSQEGESRRQIGRRPGISHQRVTAMLNHQQPSDPLER